MPQDDLRIHAFEEKKKQLYLQSRYIEPLELFPFFAVCSSDVTQFIVAFVWEADSSLFNCI